MADSPAGQPDVGRVASREPAVELDGVLAAWSPPGTLPIDERTRRFREQVGLPVDRPVVMTGHQAGFWHAGILAKYIAVHEVAQRTGAAVGLCVPDQDTVDPGRVRWPVRDAERGPGEWAAREAGLLRFGGSSEGVPAGMLGGGELIEPWPPAFDAVRGPLEEAAGEPTAARRVWAAHARVIQDRLGLDVGGPVVFATALHRTSLFAELVERMKDDPAGCVRAYNAAVAEHPETGVRALASGRMAEQVELPLWCVEPGARRRAVFAGDLDGLGLERLAPRALLFTGVLRLAGCDLFIHGTGGRGYDSITARWLGAWLGERLAPNGVATATVRLDLGVPGVTRADLRRAVWRLHHARHTPGMLGDEEGQARKDELVREIADAGIEHRVPLFREMHALLESARARRAAALAGFEGEVRRVRAALADASIAMDRAWPWALHDDTTLKRLHAAIGAGLRRGATHGTHGSGGPTR